MRKKLVLLSGGLDSATCLGMSVKEYGNDNVIALSVYYGQKHKRELQAANDVVNFYKVKHISLDLEPIFKNSNCSLLAWSNEDIPEESYSEQLDKNNGKPVSTYVPFRNGLFASCAASIAVANGCDEIYYGAHADDAAGSAYPDCSEQFNEAMGKAIYIGTGKQVRLNAPFIGKTKSEVVRIGLNIGVPYELTWSCYNGGEKPCGKCGTCRDREMAFRKNGVKDPAL